jgi:hypothetical protein
MPEYARALAYILVIAVPTFFVGWKASQKLVGYDEYALWRNCWFATTVAVFITGDFLLFATVLGLLSIFVHKQPHKAIYLYLVLLFAAPAVNITVGLPGVINKIIDFSPARLLALFFLAPAAITLLQGKDAPVLRVTDSLVLGYTLLLVVLSSRIGELTHVMRICVTSTLDILLPYFVFSRCLTSMHEIRKAMVALVVGALPVAAVGIFELVKGWRLFNSVIEEWGIYLIAPYLFRDGLLRAAVTSVEPIAFGFVCMVALGFLLSTTTLKLNLSNAVALAAPAILLGGLFASISRGPWLGFAVLVFVSLAASRRAISNLLRFSFVFAACLPLLLLTPLGERIYKLLPFVGSVDKGNEDYRSKLIDVSLMVIERNPFFGSPYFLYEPEMEQLVQGQGIIDVVNTYVAIALEVGVVSLLIFLGIFATVSFRLLQIRFGDDTAELHSSVALGTLVAILVTIATVGSVSVIPAIYWSFAGICVGLFRVMAEAGRECPKMNVLGRW